MDPFISSQNAVLERYNVICCTDTRNQTFSGSDEKLLFSCANFVDQNKRPNVNAENLPFIIIPTHVTNKGAYQVTHGIFIFNRNTFSITVLGPQAPLNKFE